MIDLSYYKNTYLHQQKQKYEELRNHPILIAFLEKYPKSEQEIMENIFKIETMILNEEKVKTTSELEMPVYESLDENFEIVYKVHPNQVEIMRRKQYYVFNDVPHKLLSISPKIAAENEDEKYYQLLTALHKAFLENKGVYLYGQLGVGKTYIIHAMLNFIIDQYQLKCIAIRSNDLIREFRQLRNDKEEYQRLLRTFTQIPVLFIDDIGSEVIDGFGRDEVLFSIIDERMNNQKLTYFTSNHAIEVLVQHLADGEYGKYQEDKSMRIVSRIQSLCKIIKMLGENRR